MSAIWIDDLPDSDIWQIGDDVAGKPRGRAAVARADFQSRAVIELELTIHPDPDPHPRHVDIRGWPIEKDERKAVALEFCAHSLLRVR